MWNINDILSLTVAAVLLFLTIFVFIRISNRLRKGGGSMLTTMTDATDAFYNREKKKAIETLVDQGSGKKLEEQAPEEE
ncbi:MAG: hypothetical protein ACE5GL_00690 [Calditrichia bacterium]